MFVIDLRKYLGCRTLLFSPCHVLGRRPRLGVLCGGWVVRASGRRSLFPLLYAFISFAQTPFSSVRERGAAAALSLTLTPLAKERTNERRRRKRIFDEELGEDGGAERSASGTAAATERELRGCKMCGTCLSPLPSSHPPCMRAGRASRVAGWHSNGV